MVSPFVLLGPHQLNDLVILFWALEAAQEVAQGSLVVQSSLVVVV